MKRFLAMLAVAAIAGAMYVAAAPGGRVTSPTPKQFKALKKQVAELDRTVKSLQKQVASNGLGVDALGNVILGCLLHQVVGVSQNGDASGAAAYGYAYTDSTSTSSFATALDLTPANGTPGYTLLTLNPDPALGCSQLVGAGGLRHEKASTLAHLLGR